MPTKVLTFKTLFCQLDQMMPTETIETCPKKLLPLFVLHFREFFRITSKFPRSFYINLVKSPQSRFFEREKKNTSVSVRKILKLGHATSYAVALCQLNSSREFNKEFGANHNTSQSPWLYFNNLITGVGVYQHQQPKFTGNVIF